MITATKKPVFVEAQQCFKQLLTIIIFFIIGFNTFNSLAQESRNDGCSTDALHLKLLNESPTYKENFDKSNTAWQSYKPKGKALKGANSVPLTAPVVLSVVFHEMIGINGPAPATVPAAAMSLSSVNYDNVIASLNSIFNDVLHNSDISFCLTAKDINGDAYTGINRFHYTDNSTYYLLNGLDSGNSNSIWHIVNDSGTLLRFPKSKFINIYILDDIKDNAGFAFMPPSHDTRSDGIYIERQWLNAANPNDIKILAHEMGHYLGLFHVFGICNPNTIAGLDANGSNPCSCDNNNCLFNGDMVCDTPPSMLNNLPQTNPAFNTCSTDAIPYLIAGINQNPITSNIDDDKTNYMDYSPQAQQDHFTAGQILRMQFMVDPDFGPRKSLLGQATCLPCVAMQGCGFNISVPNLTFNLPGDNRNLIVQTPANTPVVVFSANRTTCPNANALPAGLVYSWTLHLLDTQPIAQIGLTSIGLTFSSPNNLIAGNYRLTLTAGTGGDCKETAIFNFCVAPPAGPCMLVLPTDNTPQAWTNADFNRVSYKDGWAVTSGIGASTTTYVSPPSNPTQSTFRPQGFDILPIASGGTIPNDPNFSGVQLPSNANISSIMRIGEIITSNQMANGTAYYATKVININRNNCRFRIWYLGANQGYSSDQNGFQFLTGNAGSAYGFLNEYRYNSLLLNSNSTAHNTTIANNFTTYTNFNSFQQKHPNDLFNTPLLPTYIGGVLVSRPTMWQHKDVDYSELVDLTPESQVMITFYAHSNTAMQALDSAYCYFGLECLGGGVPEDVDFDMPDYSIPCIKSNSQSTKSVGVLFKNFFNSRDVNIINMFNAHRIQYFKKDLNGVYVPQASSAANPAVLAATLFSTDAPFAQYRVVYKTLHKTITRDFRIFVGFYKDFNPCVNGFGQFIQADNPQFNANQELLITCDTSGNPQTNNLPLLKITENCIGLQPTYYWYRDDGTVQGTGGTDATLQLTTSIYDSSKSPVYYYRKTTFKEPYCNEERTYDSPAFIIYSAKKINIQLSTPQQNNFCHNGTYTLNLQATVTLGVPLRLLSNSPSTSLTFQLNNGTNDFGTTTSFNATFGANISSVVNNISLSFNNFNPISNTYLFTPTSFINNWNLPIHIFGTYLGCNVDFFTNNGQYVARIDDSAIGGTIVYDCVNTRTTNGSIASKSNQNIYRWEYSHDNFATFAVLVGSTTDVLNNINSITFPQLFPLPVQLRRIALPFQKCPDEAASNIITISQPPVMPTFAAIVPICAGSANPLLNTSQENISGTWSPVYNANITKTYTFTPAVNQCTSTILTTITVTVIPRPVLTFATVPAVISFCSAAVPPILPLVSSNSPSVAGTWSPSSITTSGTYTFTANNGCGSYTSTVTIIPSTQPTFNLLSNYCIGAVVALPTLSTNNIVGSWRLGTNPTVVTNVNTTAVGAFTYNFIADVDPQCNNYSTTINILPSNITPIFSFPLTFCTGATAPILPTTSDNTVPITGTWAPAVVANNVGATYVFTPTAGQCAKPLSLSTVVTNCALTINWGTDVSCQLAIQDSEQGKGNSSDIIDGPCIRVCEYSTVTYELAGNLANIINTTWNVLGGTVSTDPLLTNNTKCTVTWNNVSYCALQGTVNLVGGSILNINKCVEKLVGPTANFGINPDLTATSFETCINSTTFFVNTSVSNDGNQTLFYSWNFGDNSIDQTSSEINPSHTFATAGEYEVLLTVSNGCSCSSTYSVKIKVVDLESALIECPSIVCENSVNTYIVDDNFKDCPDLVWSTSEGTILPSTSLNSVTVQWNAANPSGFAYLNVSSASCFKCSAPIKIPVINTVGTIVGKDVICANSQNTYALPQWASTVFDWKLDPGNTSAFLITNDQRNEIIIQTDIAGIITLSCNYKNTLVGCSGTAIIKIEVRPALILSGNLDTCANITNTYSILDENGNDVSGLNWTINGPNNFVTNGNGSPFSMSFLTTGDYLFNIDGNATANCYSYNIITVKNTLAPPIAIVGELVVCPSIPMTYAAVPVPNTVTHWAVTGATITGGVEIGDSINVQFDPNSSSYSISTWYEGAVCNSDVLITNITKTVSAITITDGNGNTHVNTATTPIVECGSSVQNYSTNNINGDFYVWEIIPNAAGSIQSGQRTTAISILWNQNISPFAIIKLKSRKCGANLEQQFKVVIVDTPIVAINAPATICAGVGISPSFSMALGNLPVTNFSLVTWNFGDGTPTVTSNSLTAPAHTYADLPTASTTYVITATVDKPNGCLLPASKSVNITVNSVPSFNFLPNFEKQFIVLCNPVAGDTAYQTSVNFQATIGLSYTVQWYKDAVPVSAAAGGNSTSFNFATAFLAHGTGYYTCVATSSLGCSRTSMPVHVEEICPGVPITGSGCNVLPCPLDFSITNTCNGIIASNTMVGCTTVTNKAWAYNIANHWNGDFQILTNTPTTFEANNFEPGTYFIEYQAIYTACGQNNYASKRKMFTIPYITDLAFSATCNTNNTYDLRIIDNTRVLPSYAANPNNVINVSFSYDGNSWASGIVGSNGKKEYPILGLFAGNYTIYIRTVDSNNIVCTKSMTIVLDPLPVATFTYNNNVCQNTEMQFTATDHSPDLKYDWYFSDDLSHNLQRDPVKTFDGFGLRTVRLTVTNKMGCSSVWQTIVQVRQEDLEGKLTFIPTKSCAGSSPIIEYAQDNYFAYSSLLPNLLASNFSWFKSQNTFPFAQTFVASTIVPSLTVTEPGQYLVQVTSADGCSRYDVQAISAQFIPTPAAPVIFGAAIQCEGSTIDLRVAANSSLIYNWTVNGVPDPSLYNQTSINYSPTALGSYTFGVTAETLAANGSCKSPARFFTTTVVAIPETPVLRADFVSCTPYLYNVVVTNPQPGINYYWSNGAVGNSTEMTHGGAIQVRAQGLNCNTTAQIELAPDLESFTWAFPKGCYAFCDNAPLGFVTNPEYDFQKWTWLTNAAAVTTGTNNMGDFTQLAFSNDYRLLLEDGNCKRMNSTMSISKKPCERCPIDILKTDIKPFMLNGACVYDITLMIVNLSNQPIPFAITALSGQGTFLPSTFTALVGSHNYQFVFFPNNSFVNGSQNIQLESIGTVTCKSTFVLNFSTDCQGNQFGSGRRNAISTVDLIANDYLIVAPNPTSEITTLIYNYANPDTKKGIQVIDLIGRILVSLPINSQNGSEVLDCSAFAAGTYNIVMTENDLPIKSTKLIKTN